MFHKIEIKKAKGLPRSVVSNMKFEEYLQALQTEEQPNYHEFYAIRSKFARFTDNETYEKGFISL